MSGIDTWLSVASAIAAIGSVGAAVYFGFKAHRQARDAKESAERAQQESQRLAEEASRLQALDWTSQYFDGVRAWADAVVLQMSRAIEISCLPESEERLRTWADIRSILSKSIDTGRWYFPNRYAETFGKDKPLAYRGFRRPAVEHVVRAYRVIPGTPSNYKKVGFVQPHNPDAMRDQLDKYKRMFVSEIQEILNPQHREKQIQEIVERFGIVEKMRLPSDADNAET